MSGLPKSINTTFNLGMKVLTPLHVGSGKEKEWVQGVDFYQQENSNQVVKINQHKLAKLVKDPNGLIDTFMNASNVKLSNIVRGHSAAIEQQFDFPFKSTREIKANIRTGLNHKPYIPGSSLKGAIASILGKHLGFSDRNKNVLGSPTDGTALMRLVKITDAHFEKTELVQTKLFNLFDQPHQSEKNWQGGWKHGRNEKNISSRYEDVNSRFASTYETVATKQTAKFLLHLATETLSNFLNYSESNISDKKQQIIQSDEQFLFKIINEHTKSYIQKEIAFFKKYTNKETPKIIDTFEWLLNIIPSDNSFCILKMAAGSGFHSITGDWKFKNSYDLPLWTGGRNNGKKMYKSRKIAITRSKGELHFAPMGFVLLAPIDQINNLAMSQEEIEAIEETERQKEAKKRQVEEKQAAKAAQILAEKQKEARRLNMEENAIKAFDSITQNPSVEEYQKFIREFPDSQLKQKAEEVILSIRQIAKAEAAKNAATLELEFLDYKFDSIKKLLNNMLKQHAKKGFSFSEKQQNQIAKAIETSWKIENQNPKKSAFLKKGKLLPINKYPWTDIIKWLGTEQAQKLYNQLNQS